MHSIQPKLVGILHTEFLSTSQILLPNYFQCGIGHAFCCVADVHSYRNVYLYSSQGYSSRFFFFFANSEQLDPAWSSAGLITILEIQCHTCLRWKNPSFFIAKYFSTPGLTSCHYTIQHFNPTKGEGPNQGSSLPTLTTKCQLLLYLAC